MRNFRTSTNELHIGGKSVLINYIYSQSNTICVFGMLVLVSKPFEFVIRVLSEIILSRCTRGM